jgi:hypothetical protein
MEPSFHHSRQFLRCNENNLLDRQGLETGPQGTPEGTLNQQHKNALQDK